MGTTGTAEIAGTTAKLGYRPFAFCRSPSPLPLFLSPSAVSSVSVVSLVPFVSLFKNKDPEGVNLRGLDLVLWTKPANDYKLGLIFDHSSIAGTIPKVTNSSRILQRCAYEASSLAISSSVPTGILYEQPFWSRTVSIAIMMWL